MIDFVFIASVLETPLGTSRSCSPEVKKQRDKILKRYEALKFKHDWSQASLLARAEWLEKHLQPKKKK